MAGRDYNNYKVWVCLCLKNQRLELSAVDVIAEMGVTANVAIMAQLSIAALPL